MIFMKFDIKESNKPVFAGILILLQVLKCQISSSKTWRKNCQNFELKNLVD